MNKEEWLRTVTPFDVLCPRCGWRFKEGWLEIPNWCGGVSKVGLCRECAEHIVEKSCYSGMLFEPWKVKE